MQDAGIQNAKGRLRPVGAATCLHAPSLLHVGRSKDRILLAVCVGQLNAYLVAPRQAGRDTPDGTSTMGTARCFFRVASPI